VIPADAGLRIAEAVKAEAEALGVDSSGDIREIAKRVQTAKRKAEDAALGLPPEVAQRMIAQAAAEQAARAERRAARRAADRNIELPPIPADVAQRMIAQAAVEEAAKTERRAARSQRRAAQGVRR